MCLLPIAVPNGLHWVTDLATLVVGIYTLLRSTAPEEELYGFGENGNQMFSLDLLAQTSTGETRY